MDTPGLHLAQWYYVSESSPREGGEEAEITFVANLVQNSLLRNVDAKLANHLSQLDIHATAYGIRWLRLLFLREFSFANCARLWDCMFADYAWTSLLKANKREYNISQSVMPQIAVSMLMYVKEELLQSDYSYALRRLMRYPPVESVNGFISHSVTRRYYNKELATLLEDYRPNTVVPKPMNLASPVRPTNNAFQKDHEESMPINPIIAVQRARDASLGNALASVVSSMEKQWFPPAEQTEEEKTAHEEQYLLAIAELKRVRDVLLGLVSD